jgi:serine/threonine protein kinase
VLIVDQDAGVRANVGGYLRDLGFQTRYASDRDAADGMLAMEPVDLVLSDLRIAINGQACLLKHLRTRFPDVPVVVMTGQRYVNDAIECIRSGASDYLTKPINLRYLGRCVAGLVAERRSQSTTPFVDPLMSAGEEVATRIGEYELSGVIGSGAMGTVYRARRFNDGLGGRVYALKLLNLAAQTDHARDVAVRHFLNEAETASLIRHECVVEIVEFGVTGAGQPFIVMEHLSGQTLRQWIDEDQGKKELNTGCFLQSKILRHATEALDAIHEHGIVHRDVKPDNLMLDEKSQVKIMDFGIAVSKGGGANFQEMGGSPAYLAPEVFQGLPFDHRADLFSLGVVAYELVTGQRPFVAETLDDYATAITTQHPPDPNSFGNKLPPELVAIIGRLLEKDPTKRYQAAARVTRDLDVYLTSEYSGSNAEALENLRSRTPSYPWAKKERQRLVSWQRSNPWQ